MTEIVKLIIKFIQDLVLYSDCCISQNIGRAETDLVTSNGQ